MENMKVAEVVVVVVKVESILQAVAGDYIL